MSQDTKLKIFVFKFLIDGSLLYQVLVKLSIHTFLNYAGNLVFVFLTTINVVTLPKINQKCQKYQKHKNVTQTHISTTKTSN